MRGVWRALQGDLRRLGPMLVRCVLGQQRFNAQAVLKLAVRSAQCGTGTAMRRAALLALLALAFLACVHLAAALPSQSAVLKRKRGKKKATAEQRQLAERDWVAASVQRYLSNQELGEWLTSFEKRCKAVAKLSTIGASAEGRCGHLPSHPTPCRCRPARGSLWLATAPLQGLPVLRNCMRMRRRFQQHARTACAAACAPPAAAAAAARSLAFAAVHQTLAGCSFNSLICSDECAARF